MNATVSLRCLRTDDRERRATWMTAPSSIAAQVGLSSAAEAASANAAAQPPKPRPGARRVPSSFLWGVSTSGHQIEGNNVSSDAWAMENVSPTIIKERSGDACDSLHRYEDDIKLVRALGFNTDRFSLEWARIEPMKGQFSIAMFDYYERVIAVCRTSGVRPAVSFNHNTTPIWFAAAGGMMQADGPDLFARFCQTATQHLSDGIHVAFTLNEPQAPLIVDILSQGRDRKSLAAMAAAAANRWAATASSPGRPSIRKRASRRWFAPISWPMPRSSRFGPHCRPGYAWRRSITAASARTASPRRRQAGRRAVV